MKRLYEAVCELVEAKADQLSTEEVADAPQGAESVSELTPMESTNELRIGVNRTEEDAFGDDPWEDRRRRRRTGF